MVYSAKSDDIGTISQFTRLKYIHITTNGSSTPVNYQVKLTIDYEPEMQADFSDIRFNTLGNIYIDYWIESKTDSVTATAWVELPDAITDPGSNTIWMHYGNAGLSDGGDISDTFIFGDDFPGSSLDLAKWDVISGTPVVANSKVTIHDASANEGIATDNTFGVNTIMKAYAQQNDYSTINFIGFFSEATPDNRAWFYADYGNNNQYNVQSDDTQAGDGTISNLGTGYTGWHTWEVHRIGGVSNIYKINGSTVATHTTHVNSVNMNIRLLSFVAATMIVDWIFVRTHITNEPTPSYGTAQHQRRVSQFIN